VGAVIVADNIILGTGYNGSLSGHDHCDDKATCSFKGHCIRTTHAEINAIERSIRAGWKDKLKDATIYCSHRPCYACIKTIASFGIECVVFDKMYEDETAEAYIKLVGLNVIQEILNHDES
jgi:dCMP deaminase